MTAPFHAKGERPEWRILYDHIVESPLDFGRIITYAELDAALGRRFVANRAPIYRVNRELEESHRQLEAVPTVGYRVIAPNEHVRVARGRKQRAQRQMSKALRVAVSTELAPLSAVELSQLDAITTVLRMQQHVLRMHEQRINKHEELIAKLFRKVEHIP